VLAIGGLGWAPTFPSPTHSAWGAPGALSYRSLQPTPTIRQAFEGLSCPQESNRGTQIDDSDHIYPPLSDADLERSKLLGQGQRMADSICGYLIARIVNDLGLRKSFPLVPEILSDFFTADKFATPFPTPLHAYESLAELVADSVTYFSCLARLLKSRLKYDRILSTQPFPTLDQVGPRGLLQYGKLSPTALTAFLFWRKWFMDVDNRAGQETGYLFEPLIAAAVGGVAFSASKSSVRSHRDAKGRQVDGS
jgi:hypothetical protein